ncbi:MAG: VTT domain-containing protein [Candidatus Thermoplasmatota archaeon]|nr:VTT domain-containing protein [Candidatus Thermoplasmatota archaeon]
MTPNFPRTDQVLAERREALSRMKEHQPNLYLWRVGLGIVFIAICLASALLLFKNHDNVVNMVDNAGSWGIIAFIIGLSLAVVLLMPTPFFKVFAGAIFPFHWAVIINFAGSMIGGVIAFFFGRWLFRDAILTGVSKDSRLSRIEASLGEESMRISILVRLSPILPDEWLNYILGAGPVSLRTFVISNCSSMVYCLAYAYYGYAIGEIALREGGFSNFTSSMSGMMMLIIGLIATVVATVIVTRVTVRALSEVLDEEE